MTKANSSSATRYVRVPLRITIRKAIDDTRLDCPTGLHGLSLPPRVGYWHGCDRFIHDVVWQEPGARLAGVDL